MIYFVVLTGTLTWFFELSQILSKSAKIRINSKKPTQGPNQNYKSENAIMQYIYKKNIPADLL